MKSKSKRSDKELNKSHRSISTSDRKLFYNPIFVDGTPLGVHKKTKNRNIAVKDKRVKTKKDNFQLKSCTPDTADVRSVGTITSQHHQFLPLHKVPKADTNSLPPFLEENSDKTTPPTNSSESVFGNALLLCNDLSTNCPEAMANIDEEGMSKKNASVLTDPECLGPCDPGSSVVLEGIVWNESRNGLLVVNVTWRGKTYVGTLMDSSNHHWGSPCFKDGSWNMEAKDEEVEGRRLRRNRVSSQKLLRSSDPPSTNNPNLPFHDDTSTNIPTTIPTTLNTTPINHAVTNATISTTANLKEFACTMPSCSKRFKSLSGLKTHKCVASKESCGYKPHDVSNATLTVSPFNDKFLLTNQKPSKTNGRSKQGTLKRMNNHEHLCNGNKNDAAASSHVQSRCKTKYSDVCSHFNSSSDSHVKQKANRETQAVKRNDKQKKSAKPQNNAQRKKKIKGISPVRYNSSDCKSNAFSNESESSGKNGHFNGAIKASLCKSAETSSAKDPSKDNFLHAYDGGQKQHAEGMTTLKSKNYFSNHLPVYPPTKFGATACSSPSHPGVNCTKCSLPEVQNYDPLKTPVCRPAIMSLGCNKIGEPSTAPSAVPCKDDLFNTPIEANTASEVFGQDSRHYKQASGHAEQYLYSKKQTT